MSDKETTITSAKLGEDRDMVNLRVCFYDNSLCYVAWKSIEFRSSEDTCYLKAMVPKPFISPQIQDYSQNAKCPQSPYLKQNEYHSVALKLE